MGLGLGPDSVTLPKEGWLEQPLDPFNASDRRSLLQVRPGERRSTAHPTPFSVPLLHPSVSAFYSYLYTSVTSSSPQSVLPDICCQYPYGPLV